LIVVLDLSEIDVDMGADEAMDEAVETGTVLA
jgi:hypothetical protein